MPDTPARVPDQPTDQPAEHPDGQRSEHGPYADDHRSTPHGPYAGTRTRTTRTKARKRALDILFESELRGRPTIETLAERSALADPPVRDYTAELVRGVDRYQSELDARIAKHLATGWTLARMPRVDRAAVRIAVYEIDYVDAVPDAVAVAEAVELVGELSTDESPGYVNGLLAAIVTDKPDDTHPA